MITPGSVLLEVPTGPAAARLVHALTTNNHLQSATLTMDAGFAFVLRDARVSSLQLGSSGGPGGDMRLATLSYRSFSESGKTTEVEVAADAAF